MSRLMCCAQAPCANFYPLVETTRRNGDFPDVGQPAPVGVPLGMAHIMAELRPFAAYITFYRQVVTPGDESQSQMATASVILPPMYRGKNMEALRYGSGRQPDPVKNKEIGEILT